LDAAAELILGLFIILVLIAYLLRLVLLFWALLRASTVSFTLAAAPSAAPVPGAAPGPSPLPSASRLEAGVSRLREKWREQGALALLLAAVIFLLELLLGLLRRVVIRPAPRPGAPSSQAPAVAPAPASVPLSLEEERRILASLRGRDATVIALVAALFLLPSASLTVSALELPKKHVEPAATLLTFGLSFLITWAVLEVCSQLKAWRATFNRASAAGAARSALVALGSAKLVPPFLLLGIGLVAGNWMASCVFLLVYTVAVLLPQAALTLAALRGLRRGRTWLAACLAVGVLVLDISLIALLGKLFLSRFSVPYII
jgi:hypothetical protein